MEPLLKCLRLAYLLGLIPVSITKMIERLRSEESFFTWDLKNTMWRKDGLCTIRASFEVSSMVEIEVYVPEYECHMRLERRPWVGNPRPSNRVIPQVYHSSL